MQNPTGGGTTPAFTGLGTACGTNAEGNCEVIMTTSGHLTSLTAFQFGAVTTSEVFTVRVCTSPNIVASCANTALTCTLNAGSHSCTVAGSAAFSAGNAIDIGNTGTNVSGPGSFAVGVGP